MIRTPEEGLEKFKAALKAFEQWRSSVSAMHWKAFGKSQKPGYNVADFEKIHDCAGRFKAMVEVLDLSEKEVRQIETECGISQNSGTLVAV